MAMLDFCVVKGTEELNIAEQSSIRGRYYHYHQDAEPGAV